MQHIGSLDRPAITASKDACLYACCVTLSEVQELTQLLELCPLGWHLCILDIELVQVLQLQVPQSRSGHEGMPVSCMIAEGVSMVCATRITGAKTIAAQERANKRTLQYRVMS